MLEPVSVALKFGFLVVLYLFLLWVARSALRDLRRASPAAAGTSDATSLHATVEPGGAEEDHEPHLVVERAPGHDRGMVYDLHDGVTFGRGDVEIVLDDPYTSSQHARVTREGPVLVLEDLGSTNGTFLNGQPVHGPQPLHPGDRIRIGDSEFTFAR